MKRKKLSLMNIKHTKLNRDEMRNVLAGSDGGSTCCGGECACLCVSNL